LQSRIADICDANALDKIFNDYIPEAIVYFAGLKTVGESVVDPLKYYEVNVGSQKDIYIRFVKILGVGTYRT
jgi:UDP-glucose 4-epimerase